MPRLTRAESRARTAQRLLDSAERVVAKRGFGAASVDEIADGAGFSRGAFYSNFASKEMLVLELLRRHMRGEIQQLNELVGDAAGAEGLDARLRRWAVEAHADTDWALVSAELQLLALRNAEFAAAYAELHAEHRDALAQLLRTIFERARRTPPVDPDELAAVVKALAAGLALANALAPERARIDTLAMIRRIVEALISSAPHVDAQ